MKENFSKNSFSTASAETLNKDSNPIDTVYRVTREFCMVLQV